MPCRIVVVLALAYLAALVASHAVGSNAAGTVPLTAPVVSWPRDPAGPAGSRPVTLAWHDLGVNAPDSVPAVVLHGSPGGAADLAAFGQVLADRRRVLIPDLPGSGESTRVVADYSYRAQAARVDAWLDALRLQQVHLVGFSMGGGVAITMAGESTRAARIRSLTLLSSIGVQQMELFGDYEVNHAVHRAQLAALWLAREGVPHFGWLDGTMLGVPYARTFHDSDQRPLAGGLSRVLPPTLIVHGTRDPFVPVAAAREHTRLVPQSELHLLDSDHLLAVRDVGVAARIVADFLGRVEAGRAPSRLEASPVRVQAANAPFDPRTIPAAGPAARVVLVVALALATLASEDLACISGGVLVAHGQLGFFAAAVACWIGIVGSDVGLFGLGRLLGSRLAWRGPVSRFADTPRLERSVEWLRTHGIWAIAASRFVPGTRVATCIAAGLLGLPAWPAIRTLALAALAWTPLLVGIAALATRWSLVFLPQHAFTVGLALIALPVAGVGGARRLFSHARRRQIAGWWVRVTRWEFWPAWIVYTPVALAIVRLAIRHRSLTVFTAANPGMPAGGFVGESKVAILRALERGGAPVAPFTELRPAEGLPVLLSRARAFRKAYGLPLVLKPDQGQRGAGVRVLRTDDALERAVRALTVRAVLQAYVGGPEFGLFYVRHPDLPQGRLISITAKHLPVVVGDGSRTIAALIDDDSRAVALARTYRAWNASRLDAVPARGQPVTLCELGSHSRGAIFLNGSALRTEALDGAAERAARAMPGFSFGRFDVRADDEQAFRRGRFTILELNGVTSEPTHIYDPACSFRDGVRTLTSTWALAFEIGAANARRGARIWTVRDLIALASAHRRFVRQQGCSGLAGPQAASGTAAH